LSTLIATEGVYSLDGRDIKNTVAKGTESDGGVANVGLVRERHLKDGNVTNNGRRYGGDQEQDRCDEEESGSDPAS
jgi:hypothetical protein